MEKTSSKTGLHPRDGGTIYCFQKRPVPPDREANGMSPYKSCGQTTSERDPFPGREAAGTSVPDPLPHSSGERVDSFSDASEKPKIRKLPHRGQGLRICGILYPDGNWLEWSLEQLSGIWGQPQRVVSGFPFNMTDYYREISPSLKRAFVSFHGLQDTTGLPFWKIQSGAIERISGEKRHVNLDPGYVDGARVVLASTKDHSHRIYMGQGIFAEITMRYCKGKWQCYPHTFPDFKTGKYDAFFSQIRKDWRHEIRGEANEIDRTLPDR